ncbi:CsbD family protein [Lysobacter xanthus]
MDNKRTDGMGHEVKGSIKEAAGKLTGDRSQQLAGNVEKNAGKVERSVGRAQDDLRSAERDTRR